MTFSHLLTWSWWRAALIRSARTAIVTAVPFVPVSYTEQVPYISIVYAASFGFISALLTSLAGLPETDGTTIPWWQAVLSRVVKSIAQGAVSAFGTAVLITDVDWVLVANAAWVSGFGSLLLAVLSQLPEVDDSPETSSPQVLITDNESVDVAVPGGSVVEDSTDTPSYTEYPAGR